MKKLFLILAVATGLAVSSCSSDDNINVWEYYTDWRNVNLVYLAQQEALLDEDGLPYYQRITAPWAPNEYVLVHWFNNRAETADNLRPLYTSTVTTAYNCRLYNDVMMDSSYTATDGQINFKVNSVISGWTIALTNMHVGDTVQLVVPYQSGYGSAVQGSIPPYSTLKFNMRLRDVPCYEVRP